VYDNQPTLPFISGVRCLSGNSAAACYSEKWLAAACTGGEHGRAVWAVSGNGSGLGMVEGLLGLMLRKQSSPETVAPAAKQ
jgi:hypothetical protein